MMHYRVFAQHRAGALPVLELASAAERLFKIPLHVSHHAVPVTLEIAGAAGKVTRRDVQPTDLEHAREAEESGRASGMSLLAAKCDTIWELDVEGDSKGVFALVALLTTVGLGPALPEDRSTLLGVRSALARFDRADTAADEL